MSFTSRNIETVDHALPLLRIHRRTLYRKSVECKMVWEAMMKSNCEKLLHFFHHEHLDGHVGGDKLKTIFVE
jgi:hypothetical protein